MATTRAPDLEQVRKSRAYKRMKEANPYEFEPTTIYFATNAEDAKGDDWQNCWPLKAAIVYHAITGTHVDVKPKDGTYNLLVAIAKKCRSLIQEKASTTTQKDSKEGETKSKDQSQTPKSPETEKKSETKSKDQSQTPKSPETEKKENPGEPSVPLEGRLEDYALEFDGIFLVVGFLSQLNKHAGDREKADSYFLGTHSEEIVKDVIKIENQLPPERIYGIVDKVEKAINDGDVKKLPEGKKVGDYKLGFNTVNFHDVISQFCRYYSPIHCTETKKFTQDELQKQNLLQCLHLSLQGEATGQVWRSPSARQLKQSGVRFEASTKKATIGVRFSEPTLTMPALVYDFKLETVVRNLLACECLPTQQQKPMTRYLQFLSGLVGDLGDVRVMKKFGLVKGTWKDLREVLDLVKRIDGSATYPPVYMALDEQCDKLWKYHDERMKRFFVRNRPAVLWFSSLAAASVIATAIYASKRRREG